MSAAAAKNHSDVVVLLEDDDDDGVEPESVAPRPVSQISSTTSVNQNRESSNGGRPSSSFNWRGQRFREYGPGEYLNRIPVHNEK